MLDIDDDEFTPARLFLLRSCSRNVMFRVKSRCSRIASLSHFSSTSDRFWSTPTISIASSSENDTFLPVGVVPAMPDTALEPLRRKLDFFSDSAFCCSRSKSGWHSRSLSARSCSDRSRSIRGR